MSDSSAPDSENASDAPAAAPTSTGAELSASSGRDAARGGLAVAGAKLYFMLVGLIQQIALKAVLGLDGYGALSTGLSAASITYNPLIQTGIQGVSREVAAADGEAQQVFRRALRVHVPVAVIAGAGFFFAAPWLGNVLGAPHIITTLRVLSAVLFLYSLYTPLVGALNGLRRFLGQAGLDVAAATLRTVGLIGGAYFGTRWLAESGGTLPAVEGAAWGFAGAAGLILLIALAVTGIGKAGGSRPRVGAYLRFVVPILLGQVLLNLLFQADALLLRRFASEAALAAGLAPEAADPFVGAYRAAQLFCFLPFQLLMSVTFILFPLLASARSKGNEEDVRLYVRKGVRLALLLAGLMTAPLIALPHGLISLVYGADAADLGAGAMRILAIGLGFFAILGVMTSALNSLGGERRSFGVTLLAVILVGSLCFAIARGTPLGAELLERVAMATSAALIAATFVSTFVLHKVAGASTELLSLLRVLLAGGLASAVGAHTFGPGALTTLAGSLSVGLLYLLVLVATREVGKGDLQDILTTLGRKKSA